MARRPTAHNPMIFRKVAPVASRRCTELRAGAECGGFVRLGHECEVCAFERAFALEYPAAEPRPVVVSRCSVCDEPAHASETDDLDRCEACR